MLEGLALEPADLKKGLEERLAVAPEADYLGHYALPKEKWLLSSALQKLIRRGRLEEALQAAFSLQAIDRTYLPRRLPIIALEDVGMANLVLCHDVLAAFGGAAWRDGEGEGPDQCQIIANLIGRLAASLKSRAACDLLCLALEVERVVQNARKLSGVRIERLVEVASNREVRLTKRALALLLLSGLSIPDGRWRRTLSRFNGAALTQVAKRLSVPPLIGWMLEHGKKTSGLAAMLPLVLEMIGSEKPEVGFWEDPDPEPYIVGLPPYAYDMHTGIGRKAITRYAGLLFHKYDCLKTVRRTRLGEAVGMGLFHIEGSRLDRYLSTRALDSLHVRTEEAELNARGVHGEEAQEKLYRVLTQHSAQLWNARQEWAQATLKPKGLSRV